MEDGRNWHERREETRELWRNHMKTCQASGINQAAYCRQHQINHHKFLYWKKRILGKPVSATLPTFAELPLGRIFENRDRSMIAPFRLEIRHPDTGSKLKRDSIPAPLLELIRVLDSACSG